MAIHCVTVLYSPSSYLTDDYLTDWLTNWTPWAEEELSDPSDQSIEDMETGDTIVEAEGFRNNRFEIEDDSLDDPTDEASVLLDRLAGETGYLNSYADWWIIFYHLCDHDEENRGGCSWTTYDSSDNYSDAENVPEEIK